MQIDESILHGIKKKKDEQGPSSVTIQSRSDVLPIDARLNQLGDDILSLYSTLSVAYGTLGSQPGMHRFSDFLNLYTNNTDPVTAFTAKTCGLLAEAMSQQRFTTTSYPIFFSYQNQGKRWLLIAVLKLKENIGLNEKTLDLNSSLSFDISHLREAARIDIDKWQRNEQPYLSFIKRGSGTDAELSQYFRTSLSCLTYTDAKHNTETTIKAVDAYCKANNWDATRRQQTRSKVYDFCKAKKDADEPVNLTALSAQINDQDPDSFVQYVRANQFEVSETFSPHPATFRNLQRLSKKFGSVSIGFDVTDLVSEKVFYDDKLDAIVLMNPPLELVTEINKALGANGSDDEQITTNN